MPAGNSLSGKQPYCLRPAISPRLFGRRLRTRSSPHRTTSGWRGSQRGSWASVISSSSPADDGDAERGSLSYPKAGSPPSLLRRQPRPRSRLASSGVSACTPRQRDASSTAEGTGPTPRVWRTEKARASLDGGGRRTPGSGRLLGHDPPAASPILTAGPAYPTYLTIFLRCFIKMAAQLAGTLRLDKERQSCLDVS
jgi:hypothetical protein